MQRLPPPTPAIAGPFGPSTSSCRSCSLDNSQKHFRRIANNAGRSAPDGPSGTSEVRGPDRRNPASQTIIRALSQCSREPETARWPPFGECHLFEKNQAKATAGRLAWLDRRFTRCRHGRGAPEEPDSRLGKRLMPTRNRL